ncbi:hypothetical protein [Streptosporangium sp. NPDC048865]|uniref:hypothetical protein n=1 Tax=Streptosporangium sp. NPDC048865 TaxID=3155766 RepID=UPI0034210962
MAGAQFPSGAAADGEAGFGEGAGDDAETDADAVVDTEQAVTRRAAQRVLIMAASVAGGGLHGGERNG